MSKSSRNRQRAGGNRQRGGENRPPVGANRQQAGEGRQQAGPNRPHARERIAQMRAAQVRRKRRLQVLAVVGGVIVVAGAAIGITLAAASGSPAGHAAGGPKLKLASLSSLGALKPAPAPGPAGPEGVPVPQGPPLASAATRATGQKVDGIGCQTNEQVLFHIHAHLTIYVNGSPRQVPAGIGIPGARTQNTPQGPFVASGNCFYWLHAHAADGIIHTESPVHRSFTLGNFFDEWRQPLGPGQLGPLAGHVTVLYNGRVYQGSPRNVPLTPHAQIQLEIGTPLVAPETITWPSGL